MPSSITCQMFGPVAHNLHNIVLMTSYETWSRIKEKMYNCHKIKEKFGAYKAFNH